MTAVLPDVTVDVDLDAEVPCEVQHGPGVETCSGPARWLIARYPCGCGGTKAACEQTHTDIDRFMIYHRGFMRHDICGEQFDGFAWLASWRRL